MEGQENVNTGMKIENIKNTKENPKMKLEDKIGLLQQQIRYYIGIIRRQNRIVRAYEMDKRRTNSEEARKRIIEKISSNKIVVIRAINTPFIIFFNTLFSFICKFSIPFPPQFSN